QRSLTILHVNTTNGYGGAAEVAQDLYESARQRGHHSWMAVGTKRGDDPHIFRLDHTPYRTAWARSWIKTASFLDPIRGKFPGPARLYTWLRLGVAEPARYAAILRGEEDFDFPATRHLLTLPDGSRPDLIHCHNLHGNYFDLRTLPFLSDRVPVFLTL